MPSPVPRKLRSKLDLNLKFFSPKHGRVATGNITVLQKDEDRHDTHETAPPPPPPPKDEPPARQYRPSWQELYTAFEVASAFGRTPSPDTPAASLEGRGEHRDSSTIFLARQLRHPQSNLSDTSHDSTHDASLPAVPSSAPATMTMQSPTQRTHSSRIPVPAARLALAQRRRVASTPDEIELRRREARRVKEQEERQAQREYAERQARLKLEKEETLRRYMEEERQRKVELEEELRRIAEQRRKKEAMEREAEELKRMLAEEKRRADRERRIQETQKHQAWREEHARREAEVAQRREAMRKEMLQQRHAIASRLRSVLGSSSDHGVLLSGWITVQLDESAAWKRRFYQLNDREMLLFKSKEETNHPLETLLRSSIRRTREYQDGYEELEGIPHAFAVEFKNGVSNWHMFTESDQDKEYLLALLDAK
ncbi:hypothetical protein B0H21DRAFT_402041 [Amylocystis lapponica]|nr:hypothetical protein B0H21DRAFT_402041 [Amylocystis lapponica]